MLTLKKFTIFSLLAVLNLAPAVAQQTTNKSAVHKNAHKELLAKQGKAKNQIQYEAKNTFVDLFEDNIEPEIDIYTEGWNSRSVNPFKESQVPDTYVIDVTGYFIPVPGYVTSNYGYRKQFGRMHKGVDLKLNSNDTVYAAFDGKVRLTNFEKNGYGNYVILRHPNGLETVYGHLNKFLVKADQVVKAGQPIALGGSTGRSTGPHLHFETRFMGYAINPSAIFDFERKTTHTDTYTFDKRTYTQPRNFAPSKKTLAQTPGQNPYKAASDNATTYTVKNGDTIASIARAYGISATTLKKLNNLNDKDTVKPGQVIKVK